MLLGTSPNNSPTADCRAVGTLTRSALMRISWICAYNCAGLIGRLQICRAQIAESQSLSIETSQQPKRLRCLMPTFRKQHSGTYAPGPWAGWTWAWNTKNRCISPGYRAKSQSWHYSIQWPVGQPLWLATTCRGRPGLERRKLG